jgi:hypothetical protein
MMHGSRKSHRTWWLSKRFQLMDAKFNNDNYKGKFIHLKLDGSPGVEFSIKSSDYMYFGSEYNFAGRKKSIVKRKKSGLPKLSKK